MLVQIHLLYYTYLGTYARNVYVAYIVMRVNVFAFGLYYFYLFGCVNRGG